MRRTEEVQPNDCKPILNGEQLTQQKIGWRSFCFPLLFVVFYIIVVLVYYELLINFGTNMIFKGEQSKILAFSTSPFNFLENLAGMYNSPTEGLVNNLLFPFLIMLATIIYHQLLSHKKLVSPDLVFWASVAASYAVSISFWFLNGWPATGTSIIGFAMIVFLLVASVFDAKYYLKIPKKDRSRLTGIKFICISIALGLSLAISISYVWDNPSYVNHLVGGAFCGAFVLLIAKIRQFKRARLIEG